MDYYLYLPDCQPSQPDYSKKEIFINIDFPGTARIHIIHSIAIESRENCINLKFPGIQFLYAQLCWFQLI